MGSADAGTRCAEGEGVQPVVHILLLAIALTGTFWILRVGCPRRRGASIIAVGIAGAQLVQSGAGVWLAGAVMVGIAGALIERRLRPDRVAACAVPGLPTRHEGVTGNMHLNALPPRGPLDPH